MTTFTNQKLYDLSVINSIKLESIKLYEFKARNDIFIKLRKDIETLLNSIKYKNLSDLTKKQFDKLVKDVKRIHTGFYSSVSDDLVKMFDDFVNVKLAASKQDAKPIVIEFNNDIEIDKDGEIDLDNYIEDKKQDGSLPYGLLLSATLLSNLLKDKEISGVGYSFNDLLDRYDTYSLNKILDQFNKAYFTAFTVEELKRELLGNQKVVQGFNGTLSTIKSSLNSIIDTSLGFIASNIDAGVQSSLYANSYIWVSIMDTKTSDICISRNKKVYQYGKGPLPPAHMRCRSSISPFIKDNGSVDEEYLAKNKDLNIDNLIKKYGIINNDGSYKAIKALNKDDLTKR